MKHHFHLVSGEVTFRDPENPEAVGSIKLNSIQKTPGREIAARHMGQAQQALQLRAFSKLGEVQVVDVYLNNISYLGRMTDEEFIFRPEGQEDNKPKHVLEVNTNTPTPFDV